MSVQLLFRFCVCVIDLCFCLFCERCVRARVSNFSCRDLFVLFSFVERLVIICSDFVVVDFISCLCLISVASLFKFPLFKILH